MINLDINKEMSGGKIVHGRVGDNSCTETVSVINNDGTPFDLSEFTITFMGNTYEYKTKVINTSGVRINDAKKGLFQFTFPNEAFSVAGSYERAYFQFTGKNNMVITTGDFEIIVFENTDLTATEAETVISEYNKLVSELQELQKKNIANLQEQQEEYMIELAQKYNEFQSNLDTLATKIEEYETNVNKSALDAKDAINSSIEEAQSTLSETLTKGLNDIHQALEEFKNGDFYTKLEADNLFVKKTDLTKENVNLGNVDNYATATQEEAEAGLAKDKFMTVQRTKQQIDKRLATDFEIETATDENKLVTPKNLKSYYDDRQKIAVAKYGLSDVTTASKLSDASWRYRRNGNEVEFFGRFNFSAATDVFNVHTLPVGFRLSADFDDTSWNVPLSVTKVANPTSFLASGFVERIGTNLLRIACNAVGNTY